MSETPTDNSTSTKRGNGGAAGRLLAPTSEIETILAFAQQRGATDVHIMAGAPLILRIGGELVPVTSRVLDDDWSRRLSYSLLTAEQIARFERQYDLDLMIVAASGDRYRLNISYNDGHVGAVIRLLPKAPLPLEDVHLPASVSRLLRAKKGLILITGSTSQGKTTTLASLVDAINRHQRKHVVTIEDPIEYLHTKKNSVVRQREVGRDTRSFANGLRAALRQDCDVIVVGEMRDYDTIRIGLTAAATGVLVMSTLHVISIDKIIERFLAYAPERSHGQIRTLLSEALLCVIHQELLPTLDGGKRVACELLFVTEAVRNLVRNRGTYHLRTVIATGGRYGMVSMASSLGQLRSEGAISDALYRLMLEHYR